MKLLLFDIDGTLLDTGGAGMSALRQGLLDAFSLHDRAGEFPSLDLAGSTDGGVVRHLFSVFGIPLTAENQEAFYAAYHGHLRTNLETSAHARGRVMPGVKELLASLRKNGGHYLGLLTGNIARGAWSKVDHFGLGGIFEFGAFGDDHHDRNELGPIALERAVQHFGTTLRAADTYVIGDTPKDIACARALGAVAVAVATGSFSAEALAACNPDHLFDDFSDAAAFEAILLS